MTWIELSTRDASYPAGIVSAIKEPPRLYAVGNTDLLEKPAIAICGSRNASEAALRYAEQFGGLAAQAGYVVISGHAKGVDRAAHKGALAATGATIVVAAEGLGRFRLSGELRDVIGQDSNILVLSPFAPDDRWTVYRAMQRNRYMVALSQALFVIESRDKGGTFEAGLECLRQKKALWVMAYANGGENRAGNRALLEKGGQPVASTRRLKQILDSEIGAEALDLVHQVKLNL